MSRYIHDKVNHQLIPVSGYGSRMATSIEDKTLTIHGSYANVEGYNYGKADITDAVELIAPIETELVASRAYSVGKQFVYRGFLYKVTAPIALDDPIVIGTNCVLAPDVTEQINSNIVKSYYGQTSAVTVNAGSSYTYTINPPADAVKVLAVIPFAINPGSTYGSAAPAVISAVVLTNNVGSIGVRSYSSQAYTVKYVIIYV